MASHSRRRDRPVPLPVCRRHHDRPEQPDRPRTGLDGDRGRGHQRCGPDPRQGLFWFDDELPCGPARPRARASGADRPGHAARRPVQPGGVPAPAPFIGLSAAPGAPLSRFPRPLAVVGEQAWKRRATSIQQGRHDGYLTVGLYHLTTVSGHFKDEVGPSRPAIATGARDLRPLHPMTGMAGSFSRVSAPMTAA